ncbi:MAG: pyruvate kinase [Caldilineaceae bacterium]
MTDIIATLGPASADVDTLAAMIDAGMSMARMNFSHGDYAFHARMAGLVRAAAAKTGKPVSLLADLQGAKVRLGWLDGEIQVAEGRQILLVGMEVDARERPETMEPDALILPVDFDLAPHVTAGRVVLIDDGNIELTVEEVVSGHVHCRVVHGGVIRRARASTCPTRCCPSLR